MTITVSGLSDVPMVGFTKRMVFPGQTVARSRHTGQAQIIGRGPGHWAGSVTWVPTTREHVRTLDRLFSALAGMIESVRLPLPLTRYGPDVPLPAGARIITGSALDNPRGGTWDVILLRDAGDLGAAGYRFASGSYINVGERLYQIQSGGILINTVLNTSFPLLPGILTRPRTGSSVTVNAPFVRARAASPDQGDLQHTGWANEPVVWDWEEVI